MGLSTFTSNQRFTHTHTLNPTKTLPRKTSNMNNNPNEIPSEFIAHFSSSFLPSSLSIPVNDHYEYLCALKSELNYSSSSGCSSYNSPTSLTSYGGTSSNSYYGSSPTSFEANNIDQNLMQRSISSHSLLHKNLHPAGISPFVNGYLDSETSPVRKVFSTGDLQCMNPKQRGHRLDSSLATEYSIIESMSKACKYSPEEKKERIERYRSKRNLRNFNKKIKYECRKTLADSRPRIRGRFARNDEIEQMSSQAQWDQQVCIHDHHEEDEDDDSWLSILDSISANLIP